MIWKKKKKIEKKKGIGSLFSILGGILAIAGFFLPLVRQVPQKHLPPDLKENTQLQEFVSDITTPNPNSQQEISIPKKFVSLFRLAKQFPQTAIPFVLGLIGVFIGAYFYKLALLNFLLGIGGIYSLFAHPFANAAGVGFLIEHSFLGMWSMSLGFLFMMLGGIMTFKKNLHKSRKKKNK
ncbi:MAG: hypothetical protein D6805_04695 [Planctomycetota bacterium]|nr:MAG: hypothetical protein D6805_04695 [Planctomycetota bacterium]